MQTFLPYKSFTKSLQCLDSKRLGKQRVEAMQILNALEPKSMSRWKNHPAVKMWKGYATALTLYHDISIHIWINRGFNNTMIRQYIPSYTFGYTNEAYSLYDNIEVKPPWLTDEFCAAHRSNLLRKDPVYYSQFGWTEGPNLPYIWPI